MKMNRRVLSLLLAVVMVLGAFTSVFAAETVEEVKKAEGVNAKIQYLVDFDHVEGYEDGELRLDRNINRAEITKLIVHAEGYKALAERLQGVMQLYTDVNTSHWANGVISVGTTVEAKANNLEMLNGYPNGTFQPSSDVTYAELAKMLVVLVKEDLTKQMHDRANTPARWAGDWMLWAEELGILEDVTVANSNDAAPRRDAFVMMYNAMYKMKFVDRVPSNETLGVVSNYNSNKNEITLNQGDRAKTFTLNNSTTYVRAGRAGAVNNYYTLRTNEREIEQYSYGSLVRVLADDKGNVTHIVELGNNKDGAINSINWKDVAEKVTGSVKNARVTDNNLRIANEDLVLTNSTRYFISDVNAGRLTEVTKADALKYATKLDNGDYKAVYAGYDVLEARRGIAAENRAKVVVFTEAKAEDATLLRAKIQQNNLNTIELEDVKGETTTFNTRDNKSLFPFVDANYGTTRGVKLQQYDVVEVRSHAVNGVNVNVVIRHEDTDNFPIVKVVDVKGADIKVQADDKDVTAWLRLQADHDQFLETEKLMDKNIQFRQVEKGSNVIDIVSIVKAGTKGELNIVEYKDGQQVEGKLLKVNTNTIVVALDDAKYGRTATFEYDVAKTELDAMVNQNIVFQVREGHNYDYLAYNIRTTAQIQDAKDEAAAEKVENQIRDIANPKAVTLADNDAIIDARKAYDALTDAQKKLVSNRQGLENREQRIKDLNTAVENYNKAVKAADDANKVVESHLVKDVNKATLEQLQTATTNINNVVNPA